MLLLPALIALGGCFFPYISREKWVEDSISPYLPPGENAAECETLALPVWGSDGKRWFAPPVILPCRDLDSLSRQTRAYTSYGLATLGCSAGPGTDRYPSFLLLVRSDGQVFSLYPAWPGWRVRRARIDRAWRDSLLAEITAAREILFRAFEDLPATVWSSEPLSVSIAQPGRPSTKTYPLVRIGWSERERRRAVEFVTALPFPADGAKSGVWSEEDHPR